MDATRSGFSLEDAVDEIHFKNDISETDRTFNHNEKTNPMERTRITALRRMRQRAILKRRKAKYYPTNYFQPEIILVGNPISYGKTTHTEIPPILR
jgi:hypothetical protein